MNDADSVKTTTDEAPKPLVNWGGFDGGLPKPRLVIKRKKRSRLDDFKSWPLIWKMLLAAIGIHVLIGLLTWPGFLVGRGESLDDTYERGQQLMKDGRYAEAMDLFQRILDQQPKPDSIFLKSAEQHRLAEKLVQQAMATTQAAQTPSTAPATQSAAPTAEKAKPEAKPPADSGIPPELRGK